MLPFLGVVGLLLAANVWASVKIARSNLGHGQKTLFNVGVWLIPFAGAALGLMANPASEAPNPPSAPVRARSDRPAAPLQVVAADLEPFDLPAHFFDSTGAPILDFEALDDWAGQAANEREAEAARQAGRRAWLLHFRDWLGPHAELLETDDAWVLSGYSPGLARAAGNYVAESRRRISKVLDGLAKFPERERSTLIALDHEDAYYHYVANYYPEEGEFAFSSGMFINAGCPHFVAVLNDLAQLEPVIAHEMTHFGLAHLSLPLWLDEGLAVNTEHRVSVSYRHHQATLETLAQHREFWNANTIQEFWSGKSFQRSDEGNALSYDLARAMVDLIGRDWASFVRFARGAKREDGGAGSSREVLKLKLGELAAAAINTKPQGSWAPAGWHGVAIKARANRAR
jgi:hypothetical protein